MNSVENHALHEHTFVHINFCRDSWFDKIAALVVW